MTRENAKKPKYGMASNVWFMVKLAWTSKEKKVLFFVPTYAVLVVATNLVNLYVVPTILGTVERHAAIHELLMTICGFVLAMMAVAAAREYVDCNWFYSIITVRSALLNRITKKSATTAYPNLHDEGFQKLRAKAMECTQGNRSAGEDIWRTLIALLRNLLGFAIYAGLLSSVQPVLIVVILVTAVAGYYINHRIYNFEHSHRDERAEFIQHLEYVTQKAKDSTAGKDIRIFGLYPWLEEVYEKAMAADMSFFLKVESWELVSRAADLCFAFLRNGVAYAYLVGMVITGGISVSEFLLYFAAVGGFSEWVIGILDSTSKLHKQSLDLCSAREFLDYPEPFRFAGGAPLAVEQERLYEIRLDNVSFRYPGAEHDTLKNINLTLHPGEKLAVVGLNGAGKTTLVKLICGFLDPTEGRVLLDGKDIREYDRTDYYQLFSAVFQTFSLLAASVAANVAQDEVNIDRERVKMCLERAGLTKKIESLPEQYDTKLNREYHIDAVMLSGGETQRLMLARALYKGAPFIILDEPTAALDPIAESEMYQKYNEIAGDRSSVYISHRLASTRFCDRIILIADAGICEEGTHAELLKRGGKYAEFFAIQSRYYQEGGEEDVR